MIKLNTKWIVPPANTLEVDSIRKMTGGKYSDGILRLLISRGVTTKEKLEDILEHGQERERNPYDMPDVAQGIEFLKMVKAENKQLIVYGDYDADGICATSLAVNVLRRYGFNVEYYINSRFIEGFGINKLGMERLLKRFPNCGAIMTVDNGTVAFEGVEIAKTHGIDILITDHHLGDTTLPEAYGVINPNRYDSKTKFKEICGTTVIYKLLYAYIFELGLFDFGILEEFKFLVGIATVGDVMPLHDENRYFVMGALEQINGDRPDSIDAILVALNRADNELTETDLGFSIVPILNACGRIDGSPTMAMDLFTKDMPIEDLALKAQELVDKNNYRKQLCQEQSENAQNSLSKSLPNVLVVSEKDYHEGIVGIIAGQLKEKYYRPAIVLKELEDGSYKGSARSVEDFPLKDALDWVQTQSGCMTNYGGHKLAAGLSVKPGQLDEFEHWINQYCTDVLNLKEFIPKIEADTWLTLDDISLDLIDELNDLRPFGQGFEQPKFCIPKVGIDKVIHMGQDGVHMKYHVIHSDISVIDFNGGNIDRLPCEYDSLSIIACPSVNYFRGRANVQLMVHNHQIKIEE